MLTFYVKHGIFDERVHDVFSFKQNRWLKPYIDIITYVNAAAKLTSIKIYLNL